MNTKPIIHVGLAFILLGIVAFTYHGDSDSSRDNAVDVKPVRAGAETKQTMPISPVSAGLVLVGGIVLVVVGLKRSS